MQKNLYLKPDEDVSRIVLKLKREHNPDITLVLPKGSFLLSDSINLKLLKKQAELLGKHISILTMDREGAMRAAQEGFVLRSFDTPGMRRVAPPIDVARKTAVKPAALRPKAEPKPEPQVQPQRIFESNYPKPRIINAEKVARGRKRKIVVSIAAGVLIILILIATLILPQANITVYAHTQDLSRDIDVSLSKNQPLPDAKQLLLPAQVLDKDQQLTKTFTATGSLNVGIKAHGTVTIHNLTGKTLKLNAATTIFTISGKVFHLAKDTSGIKDLADVDVIADQPGDDYNFPAGSRFEISNQVLGSAPDKLFAINNDPIAGGVTRLTSVITQQDIDKATVDLKNSLFASSKQQLLNVNGLTMLDDNAQVQISSINFDKHPGDQSLNFNGTALGHIKALVFNADSLKQIIEQRVILTLDPNQTLAIDKKESISEKYKSIDLNNGSGVLAVHYESIVESKVDPREVQAEVRGKSASDIKDLLLSDPRIDGLDIAMSPFWVKTAPSLSGRVSVTVATKP